MAAWLAGLLLGEGTIYHWVTTRRTRRGIRKDGPYPAFTIEMSDRAVMACVSSLVGTASVQVKEGEKATQVSDDLLGQSYGSKGSGHIRDSHALSHRRETRPGYFDDERVFVDVGGGKHSEIAQASKRVLPILE
jgi:hypothetical protein